MMNIQSANAESSPAHNAWARTGESTEQYLTFMLAGQEYGLDILRVQEIKGWETATTIPNTPHYVKGVINLRGTIVPLVDLRGRLGMPLEEYGPTTVVIVLKVNQDQGQRTMGIVVDAVSDVHNFSLGQIDPAPAFGSGFDTQFVRGLASTDERMIVLLDTDRLLSTDAM